MQRYDDVTAVILAGGQSRRMGQDKATLTVGGSSLFTRIDIVLRRCFRHRLVAGARPDLATPELPSYPDLYPGSALGGLYTGLYYAETPYIFVAPCDLAAPQERLVRLLVELRHGYEAVAIRAADGWEPLFAVYARGVLAELHRRLERGELRVSAALAALRVRAVRPDELPPGWEEGLRNLNTPDDLSRAQQGGVHRDRR